MNGLHYYDDPGEVMMAISRPIPHTDDLKKVHGLRAHVPIYREIMKELADAVSYAPDDLIESWGQKSNLNIPLMTFEDSIN